MESQNKLQLAVSDWVDDVEVGPAYVPLALLGDFQKDVADFLRGTSKEVDLNKVIVSIESGSLAIVASGLLAAAGLWHDIQHLEHSSSTGQIDSKRAAVIMKWQDYARSNPARNYKIADSKGRHLITVNAESDFRAPVAPWVEVEKYINGKVIDMGGQAKPNIHVKIASGPSLTIAATQDQLGRDDTNRLYRTELLHVMAEENLETGELRNMRLIAFQAYKPKFDENEFNIMVERGTRAWAGVDEDWLESLRSGKI